MLHHVARSAESFVVGGPVGQVSEHLVEVGVGVADESGFGGVAEQCLDDGQGDKFGVGQFGGDPDGWSFRPPVRVDDQEIVDGDVQCGGERVQVGVHARSSKISGV